MESQIEGEEGRGERGRGGDKERSSSNPSSSSSSSSSSTSTRKEGDRVEAKVSGWTQYYKGLITRVNSDGSYDIRFDDGERKKGVTEAQLKSNIGDSSVDDRDRATSSSASSTKFREGQRVEAKVAGWNQFYKGEIMRAHRDGTFDIRFDDGEKKKAVPASQMRPADQEKGNDKHLSLIHI